VNEEFAEILLKRKTIHKKGRQRRIVKNETDQKRFLPMLIG